MGCSNSDLERGPYGAPFGVKADLKELRRKRKNRVERGRQVFPGDPCKRRRESVVVGGRRRLFYTSQKWQHICKLMRMTQTEGNVKLWGEMGQLLG